MKIKKTYIEDLVIINPLLNDNIMVKYDEKLFFEQGLFKIMKVFQKKMF